MPRPTDKDLEERQKFLELLKKCRDTPSIFSKVFLSHEVFPHNQPYINSKEPFIVYRSGRQAGKTQTTAAKTVHFAFFAPQMHDQVKKECTILVVAPTQNQASIMFDRIRSLVESSDFLRKYIVKSTQTELWVRFLDGTGITKIYTRAVGETGMSIRGYCIEKNEYVYTKNGTIKISDVKNGDDLLGGTVVGKHEFEDELYKIRFSNGTSITVNSEHPFMTERGWIKASELNKNDCVEFIDSPDLGGNSIGNKKAKLLGYLYSDGYTDFNHVEFFNTNNTFTSEVSKLVETEFGLQTKTYSRGQRLCFTQGIMTKNPNSLITYMKQNNLMGEDLSFITSLKNEELISFINGLFNGDGCLCYYSYINRKNNTLYNKVEISFAMGIHEKRAIDLQYILWRLGIQSTVSKHNKKNCWYVTISDKENLEKIISILNDEKYPHKFLEAKNLLREMKSKKKYHNKFNKIKNISRIGSGTVVGFEVNPSHEIHSYLGMRTHNSPHLIIADEASFIKRDIFIALMPSGLATHAYVWLTSTPFSKTSYFYECSVDSRPRETKGIWYEYHVKSTDNPLVMSNPIYLQQVKNMTREQYMQEVDGEFLDIGNALIPRNLLVDSLGDFRLPDYCRYYLGVDVARLGTDETVYMLIAVDENEKVYVVHMEDESQSNIIDIGAHIAHLCKDYPIEAVYVESNGLGGGVIDTGAKLGCPMRSIEASPTNKAERYTKVRMVFENHNIKIREKGKLIDQLALMTREYTENGIMKVKTEGKHDDYPDALSLALTALQSDGTWHIVEMGKNLKKALFG